MEGLEGGGVGKGGWARIEVCKFIGGFNIRAFKL